MQALGLDRYDRQVDSLLDHGIPPMVTLCRHGKLPPALVTAEGWTDREVAFRFADFAAEVAGRLRDRVRVWLTLDEPEPYSSFLVSHHLLLAHGLATEALRVELPAQARVGLVLDLSPVRAVTAARVDIEEAIRVDGQRNRRFLDPVLRHAYPGDLVGATELRCVRDGDLAIIGARLDLLGVAHHQPAGLTELLCRLRDDYPDLPPLMVSGRETRDPAIRAAITLGVAVFGMIA